MNGTRPSILTNAWFASITDNWLWDIFVRVAVIGWILFTALPLIHRLEDVVASEASGWNALSIAQLVATALILVIHAIAFVLVVIRHRPIAKAPGLFPRVAAVLGSYASFAIVFFPRTADSLAINIASAVLLVIGNGLTIWVLWHLRRSVSIMAEARRLVTTGPYRYIRHPAYLFEEIAVFGFALQYLSLPVILLLGVQIAFQIARMSNEERILEKAFPEYGAYKQKVFRLMPGIY